MTTIDGQPSPDGVCSLLDTDLYKLTMQCAVLKYFPDISVSYKFTNRTPHMRLTRRAFNWLSAQITKLGTLHVTDEEIAWLKKTCPYLGQEYLKYLKALELRPSEEVDISFTPISTTSSSSSNDDGSSRGGGDLPRMSLEPAMLRLRVRELDEPLLLTRGEVGEVFRFDIISFVSGIVVVDGRRILRHHRMRERSIRRK